MNAAVLGWCSRLVFFVSSITLGAVVVSAEDQDVTVRTSLDRTAMFVGDRAAYTIEITCKRGVDVLADDVSRDKLKLGGLEVVGGDTSRRTAPDDSTVYTLRYGELYYVDDGGIDFNQDEPPTYRDFAYLAFTIGMTYQVSDTNITDPRLRAAVLRHGLLSFVFGTAIIATMINVVAGLVH